MSEVQLPVASEGGQRDAASLPTPQPLETSVAAEQEKFTAILRTRRRTGYGLLIAAGTLFAGMVGHAVYFADQLVQPPAGTPPPSPWALGAVAATTVATAWVGYQLARVGERMALPSWLIEKNPQAATAMLGIGDPTSAALGAVERVADVVSKVRGGG